MELATRINDIVQIKNQFQLLFLGPLAMLPLGIEETFSDADTLPRGTVHCALNC